MSKRVWFLTALAVLVLVAIGGYRGRTVAQGLVRKLYVGVDQENLRDTPRGRIIAKVNKGSELVVLAETEKWVKVQVNGWIWKESTTAVRPRELTGAMQAYHIMVKTRAEAEEILKQLRAGADFQELAKEKSIGPTAAQGGDLGFFFPGDFSPTFDEAIRQLKPGEISPIVEAEGAFHIFKRVK